jgi:hypothetical protein
MDLLGPFSHYPTATPAGSGGTSDTLGAPGASDTTGTATNADAGESQKGQYQYIYLTRRLSTKMVNVTVEAEGRSYAVKVKPQEVQKDLVHKVAREYAVDLPGHWHPRVISGTGDVCRYQEGDVIGMCPAAEKSLKTVTEPRTERGSAAKIPKAIGGEKPAERPVKVTKEKRNWIDELIAPGGYQEQDAMKSKQQLQLDKIITMPTDGGARPNPGPAGWGVLIIQNGKFICLWKHYDKASNNAMEISAVISGLTFLPPNMAVWLSTDSQYVQKGIAGSS